MYFGIFLETGRHKKSKKRKHTREYFSFLSHNSHPLLRPNSCEGDGAATGGPSPSPRFSLIVLRCFFSALSARGSLHHVVCISEGIALPVTHPRWFQPDCRPPFQNIYPSWTLPTAHNPQPTTHSPAAEDTTALRDVVVLCHEGEGVCETKIFGAVSYIQVPCGYKYLYVGF